MITLMQGNKKIQKLINFDNDFEIDKEELTKTKEQI